MIGIASPSELDCSRSFVPRLVQQGVPHTVEYCVRNVPSGFGTAEAYADRNVAYRYGGVFVGRSEEAVHSRPWNPLRYCGECEEFTDVGEQLRGFVAHSAGISVTSKVRMGPS